MAMNETTTSPAEMPGQAASPLIQQQVKKDWGSNKTSFTTGDAALGANKVTPVQTGGGQSK